MRQPGSLRLLTTSGSWLTMFCLAAALAACDDAANGGGGSSGAGGSDLVICGDGVCDAEEEGRCSEDCLVREGCGPCGDGEVCDEEAQTCVAAGPLSVHGLCSGCAAMASPRHTAIGVLSPVSVSGATATSDRHVLQTGTLSVVRGGQQ
ncbi:MAG: hypothetical protein ACE366_23420 [Bradymonadia bacterium]